MEKFDYATMIAVREREREREKRGRFIDDIMITS